VITGRIIQAVADHYGIRDEQVDKVKKLIDNIEFTKRDGDDVILIKIGDGIEIKIKQKEK
jgi:hypothetical protein